MSAVSTGKKPLKRWFAELFALLLVIGVMYVAQRFAPHVLGDAGIVGAVGLLLLAGTLMSELLSLFKLPHLTGYIAAGLVVGPDVLHLIDEETVVRLSPVNTLALALIAFAGGAELKLDLLRRVLRSLTVSTALQTSIVYVSMTGVFFALRGHIPFLQTYSVPAAFGVSLLWGAIAVTRSPSATLGVLAQTRAKGPLASFSVAFIMTSDVVVVVLLAVAMSIARPLIEPDGQFTFAAIRVLGHELLGTVSVGTTLGLILAVYLRFVGKQLLVVLIALGFGATEVIHYLGFEPLLAFMVAGAVVQNLSKQGEVFLHAIEETSGVIYVVFFASAGAHLKLPLLAQLWPIALALAIARGLVSFGVAKLSSRIVRDEPAIAKWGWASLVSQAGLALGMAGVIAREFPSMGPQISALAIAVVAINEVVGPILFKLALDRAGESRDTSGTLEAEAATAEPMHPSTPPQQA